MAYHLSQMYTSAVCQPWLEPVKHGAFRALVGPLNRDVKKIETVSTFKTSSFCWFLEYIQLHEVGLLGPLQ